MPTFLHREEASGLNQAHQAKTHRTCARGPQPGTPRSRWAAPPCSTTPCRARPPARWSRSARSRSRSDGAPAPTGHTAGCGETHTHTKWENGGDAGSRAPGEPGEGGWGHHKKRAQPQIGQPPRKASARQRTHHWIRFFFTHSWNSRGMLNQSARAAATWRSRTQDMVRTPSSAFFTSTSDRLAATCRGDIMGISGT